MRVVSSWMILTNNAGRTEILKIGRAFSVRPALFVKNIQPSKIFTVLRQTNNIGECRTNMELKVWNYAKCFWNVCFHKDVWPNPSLTWKDDGCQRTTSHCVQTVQIQHIPCVQVRVVWCIENTSLVFVVVVIVSGLTFLTFFFPDKIYINSISLPCWIYHKWSRSVWKMQTRDSY